MNRTIHAYGPVFQCKGPALEPDYVGKMFTVKDMKHQVRLFYNRKNVMKINENHKGSRAEVGVVHHMWVDANKRLMVHVEIQSRNPHSRARIKNLINGEKVGLSMETNGEEVELPNGLLTIRNKKITGIATTDTPDHKETYIEYANVSPDKVLKKAFESGYGPNGESSARPIALGNRLKSRIKNLFSEKNKKEQEEGKREEEDQGQENKEELEEGEDASKDKNQDQENKEEKEEEEEKKKQEEPAKEAKEKEKKKEEKEEEEEAAADPVSDPMDVDEQEKETQQSASSSSEKPKEKEAKAEGTEKTPDATEKGSDKSSPDTLNNKNVSDFNKQPSKAAEPKDRSDRHSHSTAQSRNKTPMSDDKTPMDTDDQGQEKQTQTVGSDSSEYLKRVQEENARLKRELEERNKRMRDEQSQQMASSAKKQRLDLSGSASEKKQGDQGESYKPTVEDSKKDWGETQRRFDEYLALKGMTEGGSREEFEAFVKKQMEKKLKKAKENLEFFNQQLEEDLKEFDITEEEKDNIRRLAVDTKGNPQAAAAIQSLAYATKAHRGSMMSHRASEQQFQSRRQDRIKMSGARGQVDQSTSTFSQRAPSVMDGHQSRSSLLSVTMGRFRPGFKPQPGGEDRMDVDEPSPSSSSSYSSGHLGLSSRQAREASRAQSNPSAPDRRAFMPTMKREIPEEDIQTNFKSILDRFGMDGLKAEPITRRFNERLMEDNKDDTLRRFYDHFRTGVPKKAASSISGKNLQLDTNGASSIGLRNGATSWIPISGDRRVFM